MSHGVRVHCTINTMPRNDETDHVCRQHLERLDDAGVDALIVADLGAFTLAGKYAPHCQRHMYPPRPVISQLRDRPGLV